MNTERTVVIVYTIGILMVSGYVQTLNQNVMGAIPNTMMNVMNLRKDDRRQDSR